MNRLAVALSLPIGAALLLQANPSQALTILGYEVLLYNGTLTDFLSSGNVTPGTNLPWWSNTSLAGDFATAYYDADPLELQEVNDLNNYGSYQLGPLFYYNPNAFVAYNTNFLAPDFNSGPPAFVQEGLCGNTEDTDFICNVSDRPITWAYVQPAPPAVPAPLPLLGATAAFSFSRKLRRRVNAQKFTF